MEPLPCMGRFRKQQLLDEVCLEALTCLCFLRSLSNTMPVCCQGTIVICCNATLAMLVVWRLKLSLQLLIELVV